MNARQPRIPPRAHEIAWKCQYHGLYVVRAQIAWVDYFLYYAVKISSAQLNRFMFKVTMS